MSRRTMTSAITRARAAVTIRGSGRLLLVPAAVVLAAALGMPLYLEAQGHVLPAANVRAVQMVAAGIVVTLGVAGAFLSTRRLTFAGRELTYSTWFKQQTVAADDVTDATIEDDVVPSNDGGCVWQSYLVLWEHGDPSLRLNRYFWPAAALRELLAALCRVKPEVQLGPRARHLLDA